MKKFFILTLLVMIAAGLSGCKTAGELLPPNDRVLVYHLPYDLTYLRTMEALDGVPNWDLDQTDKEQGVIMVRNINYSRLDDSDQLEVTFLVKRVDRGVTSVSIAPETQKVYGGKTLLDTVAAALGREATS